MPKEISKHKYLATDYTKYAPGFRAMPHSVSASGGGAGCVV